MSLTRNFSRTGLMTCLVGVVGLLASSEQAFAQPKLKKDQPKAEASDARASDRAAVRAAMESFRKAFESRDSKALSSLWTDEAEYENESGTIVRGRANIEKGFAALFAKNPELIATLKPKSLRFLSRDSAVDEGLVTIRRGSANATTTAGYSAYFVREDGKWKLTRLNEVEDSEPDSVADLAWIAGEWKSALGEGAEVRTHYTVRPNEKFIDVEFELKEKDLAIKGTQVIGVDPATGKLHTWTFEGDGGVGSADWNRDGDHWVLNAVGTLADGKVLTETNVIRKIDDNTMTWQSVNRMLGEIPLSDLPPVKITRVKPAK